MKRVVVLLLAVFLLGGGLSQIAIPPSTLHQIQVYISEYGPGFRAQIDAVLKAAAAVASGVAIAWLQRQWEVTRSKLVSLAEAHAPPLEEVHTDAGPPPRQFVNTDHFVRDGWLESRFWVSKIGVGRGLSPEEAEAAAVAALEAAWFSQEGVLPHFTDYAQVLRRFYASFFTCSPYADDWGAFSCAVVGDAPIRDWQWVMIPAALRDGITFPGLANSVSALLRVGRPEIVRVSRRSYADTYEAMAAPAVIEVPFAVAYEAYGSVGVDYCYGWYDFTVVALYSAVYVFQDWGWNFYDARYALSAVVNRGAIYYVDGVVPHERGIRYRVGYANMAPTYEFAIWEAAAVAQLIRNTWGRVCLGVGGADVRPYPWDIPGALDTGVAVRGRDAADVWWIARPRQWLEALFLPSTPLAVRFERLQGLLADRFPFSVAIALREYVPPVADTQVDAPCFSVGHGRQLCPNPQVLGTVAAASRWGMVFVLGLGVTLWLQRRVVPWLRL